MSQRSNRTNKHYEQLDVSISDNLRFIESRKKLQNLSAYQILTSNSARMLIVLACGIIWGIKLLDFTLFSIYTGLDRKRGGLGFSTIQTGSISLLGFPLTAFLLVILFKPTQHFRSSVVLNICAFVFSILVASYPLYYLLPWKVENVLLVAVVHCSLKEVASIIWLITWSNLFSKLFPSRVLGKIYSWSFLVGHLMLAGMSQFYPRLLTVFIESQWMTNTFKDLRIFAFFVLLALPCLISIVFVFRAKYTLFKLEEMVI